MLEKILRKTSRKILEYLNAEGEKSLSVMTGSLGLSKPAVIKHLKELESIGIVSKRKEKTETGVETFYSLNRFSLVMIFNPENKTMINIKSFSDFKLQHLLLEQVEDEEFKEDLREFLTGVAELGEEDLPRYIILFGSVARGEGTWKSDVDVALLDLKWERDAKKKIEELISDVTMGAKHPLKPHFLALLEFEGGDSLLIKEIKESGLVIYGDIFRRRNLWREMKRYRNIIL